MNADTVVIQGIVLADRTLQLEDKILLPPGKVSATLRSAPSPERAAELMEFVRGIRAIRERDGVKPDAEAAQAALRQLRDEAAEEVADLEFFRKRNPI
jgi:hypothetical protein